MDRTVHKRVYSAWIVVEPAEDIPGLWVSHCLNFDVISQGATPSEAADSVCEAVSMSIVDDLAKQLDPLERGSTTPPEDWQRLKHILESGKPVKMSEIAPGARVFLARQVNFTAEVVIETIPVSASRAGTDPRIEPSVVPLPLPVETIGAIQLCA